MSGAVRKKSDIDRIATKWFPEECYLDDRENICRRCLDTVLVLSEAIKERCCLYNQKKSKMVPSCENNGANLEKTGDNCPSEHAYVDCAKEIYDLMKAQDSQRKFDEYLNWRGFTARRVIKTRVFGGSRGYYPVERTVEVKLKDQIHGGISHLRSRADDWILNKSQKLRMRMPFMPEPPSFIVFPVLGVFVGFIMRNQM